MSYTTFCLSNCFLQRRDCLKRFHSFNGSYFARLPKATRAISTAKKRMTLGSKMGSVNLVPIVCVTGQGNAESFPIALVKGNEDAGYEDERSPVRSRK